MLVKSCIPVIPSADLERSLRFWVEALGLTMDRAMRHDGKLIGCMVHNEHVQFWLNQQAGDAAPPENYDATLGEKYGTEFASHPEVFLRQGEIHERLGNGRALEDYRRFLARWRDADAEYKPLVRDVQLRMARLARE